MKIIIDMNLSPSWAIFFQENGYETAHWSNIGLATATDEEIFDFA